MKKRIAILLIAAIVACVGAALAEKIDFTGISDEELITILAEVQEEIVARHIDVKATLREGAYIAGRDIPAGSYIYTCLATGNDWGNVTIRSEKGAGKQLLWKVVLACDEGGTPDSFFITLNEDDELDSGVPFSLTVYTGAVFK